MRTLRARVSSARGMRVCMWAAVAAGTSPGARWAGVRAALIRRRVVHGCRGGGSRRLILGRTGSGMCRRRSAGGREGGCRVVRRSLVSASSCLRVRCSAVSPSTKASVGRRSSSSFIRQRSGRHLRTASGHGRRCLPVQCCGRGGEPAGTIAMCPNSRRTVPPAEQTRDRQWAGCSGSLNGDDQPGSAPPVRRFEMRCPKRGAGRRRIDLPPGR